MRHFTTLLTLTAALAATAQATHELEVEDFEFNPAVLTINLGDHVHIHWDDSSPNHTFTQVDQATWNANGSTSNGGYNFGLSTPNPGTDFTITPTATGTIWYVCIFHVSMGMKGEIIVLDPTGIEEASAQDLYVLAPNPASSTVQLLGPASAPVMVEVFDPMGKLFMGERFTGNNVLDVGDLPNGIYIVTIREMDGMLLSTQRLEVQH